MAIIIPSSNIYNIYNQKIRDNIIDRIEIDATQISPNNNYEIQVYNESVYSTPSSMDTNNDAYNVYRKADDSGSIYGYWIAFSNISNIRYYNLSFNFSRLFNNSYIEKVESIKYTIYYDKITYDSSRTASFFPNDYEKGLASYSQIIKSNEQHIDGTSSSFDFTREYEYSYTPDIGIFSHSSTNKSVLQITKPNFTNIDDKSIIDTTNDSYYQINGLKILGEYEQSLLGAWEYGSIGDIDPRTIFLQGKTYKYIAKKLEITVYGNTNGINLESTPIVVSVQNPSNPFSVSGNELMQTENYYSKGNVKYNQLKSSYSNTLNKYLEGKETATILCSINDYYDTYGNKIIAKDQSTGKMLFDIYDEVLPMVSQPLYPNVPMSLLPNGNAKTFSVLGSRIYYDGAIWQELTIQEYDNIDYHIDGTLGLTYSLSEDGYAICTGVNALYSPTEVIIPARVTINGTERNVVEIGESAFENNATIENVTIGRNVKYINPRAFFGCSKLKEITIPDNVLEIGTSAYENCSSVSSINIGKNVEYIGEYAFANLSNVSEIYFNASECASNRLPFIGTGATAGYGYADLTLNVGEEVTIIPSYMFEESSINYIYISSGLCHTIGQEAFYNSKNLTEVRIPRNIETIEQYAFWGTNLTTVWYEGTSEEWATRKNKIIQGVGNDLIRNAVVFGYS